MLAIRGNFTLHYEESGKYSMNLVPDDQILALQYANLPLVMGRFTGNSTNPVFEIEIEALYLNHISMGSRREGSLNLEFSFQIFSPIRVSYIPNDPVDVVEFKRGIANLLFWGTEVVQRDNHRVLAKITWHLAGNDVVLEQLPSYETISHHLAEYKDVAVTCELKMVGNYNQLAAFDQTAENLQTLLSLASANFITAIYEDIYFNGQISVSTLFPLKTYLFSDRQSLIDNRIGNELKDFVNTTYQSYVNLKDNLGLPYFIEFFTTSKMYSPLEVEYILSATAFECLEDYFRRWQHLREIKLDLKGKIARMCSYFGFTVTDSVLEPYRVSRNSLSHTGKFPAGSNNVALTMTLRNLIDRFILIILGYRNKRYYNALIGDWDTVP